MFRQYAADSGGKKVTAVKEMRLREADGSSASVGLLVSILVRYPEICTISYVPESRTLGFSFMVSRRVEAAEIQAFKHKALTSIRVYLGLLKAPGEPVLHITGSYVGDITQIQLTRDVATLTADEISLLIGLILAGFSDNLITDRSEDFEEEDLVVQDEFIANLLADLKESVQDKGLIGFREEGRVVVFNKTA